MERLQIDVVNPKAIKLLNDLAELNLILITESRKDKSHIAPTAKNISHDTYPFKPQYIKFENAIYILKEKLNNTVDFEDGQYIISNKPLDIAVWGETRDMAEEAFAFTFHSLYENFVKEDSKNLTAKAKRLKQTLKHLVGNVINNYEG